MPQMPTHALIVGPSITPVSTPTQCQAADVHLWKDRWMMTPQVC